MKILNKASLVAAAVALSATPVVASAAQSASTARIGATADESSQIEGENGILIAILAAAAVIAGIIILADGSENTPTSP